jgi:thymidylate synthase
MQWAVDEDGIDKTFKQIAKDILEYGRVSHPRGK